MSKQRHTILVVDDEPDVVKSVQDLLRFDYRVLGATRASEALRLLREHDVHVVMSDQRMAEMSGVELLSRVRVEHPDAVRLLFTGYADIRAVIDAINQGNVYRYITKPWEPDELQAILREAIERYELVAERKRLIGELAAKNAELERANAALRHSDELKTAFIQVASHELRTPLAILQGLTDLATRIAAGAGVPAGAGAAAAAAGIGGTAGPAASLPPFWLEQVRKAVGRLVHLVNQIVAMLAAGQYATPLDLREVEVAPLLAEAMDDVRVFVEQRRQRARCEWDAAALGRARLDRGKIRDCLNHLLLNAIKFTPDGGTITLAARRAESDGALELSVADTGIGISRDALPRLGDRFFTGFDVSTHSSGHFEYNRRGLGLGLSVVKSFVEMHGGSLAVESEVGKGTTFTLRLPERAAAGASAGAPPAPAPPSEQPSSQQPQPPSSSPSPSPQSA